MAKATYPFACQIGRRALRQDQACERDQQGNISHIEIGHGQGFDDQARGHTGLSATAPLNGQIRSDETKLGHFASNRAFYFTRSLAPAVTRCHTFTSEPLRRLADGLLVFGQG